MPDLNAERQGLLKRSYVFRKLSQHRAQLQASSDLGKGLGAAIWANRDAQVSYRHPEHHTLSFYLTGGYDTQRLFGARTLTGGAPSKLCMLPADHHSDWLVQQQISMAHLYFSTEQWQRRVLQVFDRDPRLYQLQDLTFVEDPRLTALFNDWILRLDWCLPADRLALSTATEMVLIHLVRQYSASARDINVRGGLAPTTRRRIIEFIEANLAAPLLLTDLAEEAGLSEYHFARMFRLSMGMPPHQYVMERRIQLAKQLLTDRSLALSDVALRCGFSTPSHFSNRFKADTGLTPGRYRRTIN